MDTPTPGADAEQEQSLAERVLEHLARLDEADLARHPEVYGAIDEAIRAELRDLERLTGDADG